ncbi:MAG TPA: peptide ABC transporter substrate-binding protein [Nevskiaceae bacterium]|nr:peptide ABC transporter substrate-binding protein [Nevskiaceae bacterium]
MPGLRPLLVLLATLAVPLAIAADPSTLRKGNGPEPESLDPHKARSVSAQNVVRDLFEGLVGESPEGTLVPGAAEGWETSEDGRTWTFHLREGLRWSNGDPLTADDFAAGLRRSADPATGGRSPQILAPIENALAVVAGKLPSSQLGVEVLDTTTLRIRLASATPYFLGMLAHPATFPVHRDSLARDGTAFTSPGRLVSNGAYRLAARVTHSHLVLERNRRYWNDAHTAIERVVVVTTEDGNAEFKRFRAGELDWTEAVPASQAAWVRAHLADVYHVHPYLGVYFYGFNVTRPPFQDNPALRRALALAVDRDVIVQKVLGSGERAASGWIPPGVAGYRGVEGPWAGLARERRLAEARRLYAEAGYSASNPLDVEIRYNTNDDQRKIATAIAAMWKQWLGVRPHLVNQEMKVFLQNRRMKVETQVYRASWIGDYDDAFTFLEPLRAGSGVNDAGWSNPRYETLLVQAAAERDMAARERLMQQAEQVLLDDLPVLPIYHYVSKRLVSRRVTGWKPNLMDHHYAKDMRLEAGR